MRRRTRPAGAHAFDTYETFAPFYDAFTAHYEYETWMRDIEALARAAGLRGRRLLDVGCGTGKSFMPMLDRGYEVVACDLSPAMVERARRKAGGRAEVVVADMRDLPWRDRFDLVTCVDDAMNYLLSTDDLIAALRSFYRSLRPGGVSVFDLNSLITYRTEFARDFTVECEGKRFAWHGEGSDCMPPGEIASARIEVLSLRGDPTPVGRHVQRHYPIATVEQACVAAGLELVSARGECPDKGLVPDPDEQQHPKVIYATRRPPTEPRTKRLNPSRA